MSCVTASSFVLVGAFWGCTTPFIKSGTTDESGGEDAAPSTRKDTDIKTRLLAIFGPLRSLASAKAAVPFLLNQSGSLLYYYLLGSQDISMAVPVCNALTFVFTALTAFCLGEKVEHPRRTIVGMALVLAGIGVCVASKDGTNR